MHIQILFVMHPHAEQVMDYVTGKSRSVKGKCQGT
jgi:hypothetical protein